MTLRLPASVLGRIRQVADALSLPYHTMVRSWIVRGLRTPGGVATVIELGEPLAEQLNIKLDQDILDDLKARADELRSPYHRLARGWIEATLRLEEEKLGLVPAREQLPPMKELMVLLLHSADKRGQNAVRGATRLQKLLFVVEQKLLLQKSRFYAYNFGPFSEEVSDAADALRLAGFLRGAEPAAVGPPSFAEMASTVLERSGPREQPEGELFALNDQGHEVAERLRHSGDAYEQLYNYIYSIRAEWDTPELIERVYEEFPKYTEKSLIRDQVDRRRAKRRSG
ncbi:MAG TPA: hypothetical protein VHA57_04295 [Actinomycetota bacterium]|nr:hypothetical protein [Actinomycetota bacterium]